MARTPQRSDMELEGIYLYTMQQISRTLMESLPADEKLWRTLKDAEARLLEAQRERMSPTEVFGSGGPAAFCQSVIDSFKQELLDTREEFAYVPASKDKSISGKAQKQDPRKSLNYRKMRNATGALTVLLIMACLCAVLWYTGLFNYWFGGSDYYVRELYNFENRKTQLDLTPQRITMSFDEAREVDKVLYADEEGFTVQISGVNYDGSLRQYETDRPETSELSTSDGTSDGKPQMIECYPWYVRILYTADISFTHIAYVEPCLGGATATVTFPDGHVETNVMYVMDSGSIENGYEYLYLYIGHMRKGVDLSGATITVEIPGFQLVEYDRITTGKR